MIDIFLTGEVGDYVIKDNIFSRRLVNWWQVSTSFYCGL